VKCRH